MSLITYLSRIHFADGVLEDALLEEMQRAKVMAPLLITDGDATPRDALDRIEDLLPDGNPPSMCAVVATSPDRVDPVSVDIACEAGHDVVIGIGGETALSHARAIGARTAVTVITVPTTPAAIGIEPSFDGRALAMPDAVLCDPTLILLDTARAAQTGSDALSHAIEAYLADGDNPPADGIALEAVRRAATGLPRWVAATADPETRREIMAVAINAALASRKGLGAVEALARAIDTATGKSEEHGRWHMALLPPVLAFNAPAVEARLVPLAQALGVAGPEHVVPELRAIGVGIGMPETLAPLGLTSKLRATVARDAAAQGATRSNPRHAVTDDFCALLEAAH